MENGGQAGSGGGQLRHGAYPKKTDGLRLTIADFCRHASIMLQEDIPNHLPQHLAEDCSDPHVFKRLAGFDSLYQNQVLPVLRAVN